MGRRSLSGLLGAFLSPGLLLMGILMVSFAIGMTVSSANTCEGDNSANGTEICSCAPGTFLFNDTCEAFKVLHLTVVRVTTKSVSFLWSLVDLEHSDNVTLNMAVESLGSSCSTGVKDSLQTNSSFSIENLNSSTLMNFTASANYNGVPASEGVSVIVLTVPKLPNNIHTEISMETSANITWTFQTACIPTFLEFKDATKGILVANVSAEDLKANLISLTPGTITNVSVTAIVSAGGRTSSSDTYIYVKTIPLAPEKIVVTSTAYTLNVSISPPLKGAWEIFELYRRYDNLTWYFVGKGKTFLLSSLEPYTEYHLKACTLANELRSKCISHNATTPEDTPGIPVDVNFTDFKMSWKPPLKPNGKLLGYDVFWSASCGNIEFDEIKSFNTSVTQWNVSSEFRLPGHRVCVKVRTRNNYNSSEWSEQQCNENYILNFVNSLNVNVTSTTIHMMWSTRACLGFVHAYFVLFQTRDAYTDKSVNGCLSDSQYLKCANCDAAVSISDNFVSNVCSQNLTLTPLVKNFSATVSTNVSLTTFSPGGIYRVTVLAVSYNNKKSQVSNNFTSPQVKSEVPFNSLFTMQARSAELTWSQPLKPGGLILNFVVWSNKKCYVCNCTDCKSRFDFKDFTVDAKLHFATTTELCSSLQTCRFQAGKVPSTPLNVTDLQPYTNYSATLVAVNSLGFGKNISIRNVTLQTLSEPPNDLQISERTDTSIRLAWKKPDKINGILVSYQVRISEASNILSVYNTSNLTKTIHDLTSCGNFSVIVITENGAGLSKPSKPIILRTLPTVPPKIVKTEITAITSYEVNVNWTAVSAPGFCSIRYHVILTAKDTTTSVINTTNIFCTFVNRLPHSEYQAKVFTIASNSDNETKTSVPSFSDWVRTEQGIPTAPRNVFCYPTNYTTIICFWKPPEKENGVVRYHVNSEPSADGTPFVTRNLSTSLSLDVGVQVNISVFVFASTTAGQSENASTRTKLLEGPPPIPKLLKNVEDTIRSQAHHVADSQTQVKLIVDFRWFDAKRGQVTKIYVLVRACTNGVCDEKSVESMGLDLKLSDISTYKLSSIGVTKAYAAFLLSKTPRSKRSVVTAASESQAVTIGLAQTCVNDEKVCNGPLEPGTTYMFFLRGFTPKGFATLAGVKIATSPKPQLGLPIGLSLAFIAVVGVAVLIFFVVKRRRRKKQASSTESNGYVGISLDPRSPVKHDSVRTDIVELSLFPSETTPVTELARLVTDGKAVEVPLVRFEEFVEEMNRDSMLKYTDAFNALKKQATLNEQQDGLTTDEASQQCNRLKNRFANVLPFDQTRICLRLPHQRPRQRLFQRKLPPEVPPRPYRLSHNRVTNQGTSFEETSPQRPAGHFLKSVHSDDDPNSGMDYINANFVGGFHRRREFIACQGPLPQTLDDFWRMVWEQNVPLIVMLTKTSEKGRNKCEQYWPRSVEETRVYGDLAIQLVSESCIMPYVVRRLCLTLRSERRELIQVQMLNWFDFTAPSPEDLTALMQAYRSYLPPPNSPKAEAPTIVHCSAGVGRTGTFICLETLLRRLEAGNQSINVNEVIFSMRKQRRLMVQSEKQYIFIHDFLVSYLKQRNASKGEDALHHMLNVEYSRDNDAFVREDIL